MKANRGAFVIPSVLVTGLLAAGGALPGCSSEAAVACHAGADCASGICNTNGTCAPVTNPSDSGLVDAGGGDDAMMTADGPAPDAPVTGCVPNNDGTVLAEEVPLKAGLHANFRDATNVTFDTAGQTGMGGARTWDLSAALPGDQTVPVDTLSVMGTWYAPSFSAATYATKLSQSSDLLGVFHVGAAALELLGVVSPASGVTQTSVSYSPAAAILQFPMKMGSAWKTTSTITGTASGVAVYYTEAYDSSVDAHGTLKTPYGSFPVLRVSTVLTKTVGLLVTTTRSYAFVAECFGTVATLVSQANESNVEFSSVAEASRIAP